MINRWQPSESIRWIELTSPIAKRIRPLTNNAQKVLHGGIVMVLPDKDAAFVGE